MRFGYELTGFDEFQSLRSCALFGRLLVARATTTHGFLATVVCLRGHWIMLSPGSLGVLCNWGCRRCPQAQTANVLGA